MCSHSDVKLREATHMFMLVDYVREMTVEKSCKYCEYGSFEHLFFLFCVCVHAHVFVCVCVCVFVVGLCGGGWGEGIWIFGWFGLFL